MPKSKRLPINDVSLNDLSNQVAIEIEHPICNAENRLFQRRSGARGIERNRWYKCHIVCSCFFLNS